MTHTSASPFDALAADYDRDFTANPIGRLMRDAVWARIDRRFHPGQRILEMNCGTGEDAIHLASRGVQVLATDVSPEMVRITAAKSAHSGVSGRVQVRQLAWEEIPSMTDPPFDGFLSDFGGINCVSDIAALAPALAGRMNPGASGFICAMGPCCIWEWLWYTAHGNPAKAFRRLRNGGVEWRGIRITYPSVRRLRSDLEPCFRVRSVTALGVVLPPPFAESILAGSARWLERLDRWERRLEAVPPLPSLADHYLLEVERNIA